MEAQRGQWAVCGASAALSLRRGTWRGTWRGPRGSESAAGCCVASMGTRLFEKYWDSRVTLYSHVQFRPTTTSVSMGNMGDGT